MSYLSLSNGGAQRAFILLMLAILLQAVPANCLGEGNSNVVSFDYFSQEDGLPNNQIQCIYQDKRGWIWLGTSQGPVSYTHLTLPTKRIV